MIPAGTAILCPVCKAHLLTAAVDIQGVGLIKAEHFLGAKLPTPQDHQVLPYCPDCGARVMMGPRGIALYTKAGWSSETETRDILWGTVKEHIARGRAARKRALK